MNPERERELLQIILEIRELAHLQPPSREPGQADAELEADIAAFRTEMKRWNNPPGDAALTVRILADRTRDKERIEKLERRLRHIRSWAADTDRALLEVPDGE